MGMSGQIFVYLGLQKGKTGPHPSDLHISYFARRHLCSQLISFRSSEEERTRLVWNSCHACSAANRKGLYHEMEVSQSLPLLVLGISQIQVEPLRVTTTNSRILMGKQEWSLLIFVSRLAKDVFSISRPSNVSSQFIRFTFTGSFTASLDFLLLVLLVEGFSAHYLVAAAISFVVAVTLNYLISLVWVFEGGRYSRPAEFLGFFATSGVGLGLNQLILWVSVGSLLLDYRISKIVAIAIVAVWNYATKKYLVFRDWL